MSTPSAKLSDKHRRFIDEYLVDLNGTQAAIRAGYSKTSARIQASQLLTKPNIQAALRAKRDKLAGKVELTAKRVLTEIARLCFFNPKHLFAADGSPIDVQSLDDGTAAAIAGIEVVEMYDGQGEDRKLSGYTKKYRLHDKSQALHMAARYLNLFPIQNVKLSGSVRLEDLVEPTFDPKEVQRLSKLGLTAKPIAGAKGKQ